MISDDLLIFIICTFIQVNDSLPPNKICVQHLPPIVSILMWFIGVRLLHFSNQRRGVFALFDKQKTETILQSVSSGKKIYISFFITPDQLLSNCCHRFVCDVRVPSCSIITINNWGNEWWCAFEAAGWTWKKCETWNKTYLRWSVIKVIIDWYVYTYYGVVTIATHRVMRRPGSVLLPCRAIFPIRWMRLNIVNYITPDGTLWKTIHSIDHKLFCSVILLYSEVAIL